MSMRHPAVAATLLVLAAVFTLLVRPDRASPAAAQPARPGYATNVKVQAVSPGVFLVSARVADLHSGEVLAAPSFKVRSGESFSGTTNPALRESTYSVVGTIDSEARQAIYTVRGMRGATVMFEHTASVALR